MKDFYVAFNEKIAVWSSTKVGTMTCAYIFGVIALVAFPQAIHDSFSSGFAPLPLVTWLSQSFLQLTLLSVIMVGQSIQSRATESRMVEQYNAVMEMLQDMRDEHTERHEILLDIRELVTDLKPKVLTMKSTAVESPATAMKSTAMPSKTKDETN